MDNSKLGEFMLISDCAKLVVDVMPHIFNKYALDKVNTNANGDLIFNGNNISQALAGLDDRLSALEGNE